MLGKTKIKLAVSSFMWVTYAIGFKFMTPFLNNEVAVKQFEDTNKSFVQVSAFDAVWGWIWIPLLIATGALFIPEVKRKINGNIE